MPPRLEYCLLHRILRIRLRTEHADCQTVRGREKRLNQKHEGMLVTANGLVDERRRETHCIRTIRQPGQKSRSSLQEWVEA